MNTNKNTKRTLITQHRINNIRIFRQIRRHIRRQQKIQIKQIRKLIINKTRLKQTKQTKQIKLNTKYGSYDEEHHDENTKQ